MRSPQRFTKDGDAGLEQQLGAICERVSEGLRALLPTKKLEAIILGGGYGRGEGGVLKTKSGDKPYNDLEFYVFLKGPAWLNARRHSEVLEALAEQLSPDAGVHIEFKIDSLAELQRRPISMFSYDLVAKHRTVWGKENTFDGCEHHLDPTALPRVEATRLLLNRCTGLLLARSLLAEHSILSEDQADFIGRNLSKLRLALGDALLTIFGQYHWSCIERHKRLLASNAAEMLPEFETIQSGHAQGIDFKLHPWRINYTNKIFKSQANELSQLAFQIWVWLESRRLGHAFLTPLDYALSPLEKCAGSRTFLNYLLNLRTFGPKALLGRALNRYPRERLFNTLPLLLWQDEATYEPKVRRHLQEQLMTKAVDWSGWFAAYRNIWPQYG
ncbi:MAG TPA: hypothetical protein VL361_21225 [Candidatus Limnocylindrales bacterium]|jgi:hypothetical protein|nr:hypothetical protein [Candidatus Limnocylindrales bacterium]